MQASGEHYGFSLLRLSLVRKGYLESVSEHVVGDGGV
jgi:hypothetical protein